MFRQRVVPQQPFTPGDQHPPVSGFRSVPEHGYVGRQQMPSGQMVPDRYGVADHRATEGNFENMANLAALLALGSFAREVGGRGRGTMAGPGFVGYGLGSLASLFAQINADDLSAGHGANAEGIQARTQQFGNQHPGVNGYYPGQ